MKEAKISNVKLPPLTGKAAAAAAAAPLSSKKQPVAVKTPSKAKPHLPSIHPSFSKKQSTTSIKSHSQDDGYVRPTLQELDETGILPLVQRGLLPLKADYTRAFVRAEESDAILSHHAVVPLPKSSSNPTPRPERKPHAGFNEFSVRYARKPFTEEPHSARASSAESTAEDREEDWMGSDRGLQQPRYPTLEDLTDSVRANQVNLNDPAWSNIARGTTGALSSGSGRDEVEVVAASAVLRKRTQTPVTRAPIQRTTSQRRKKDDTTTTMQWRSVDSTIRENFSPAKYREMVASLAEMARNSLTTPQAESTPVYLSFDPENLFARELDMKKLTCLYDLSRQSHDIVMRNGKVMEMSTGFTLFKKQNQLRWGPIAVILKQAERVAKRYNLNYVTMDSIKIEIAASYIFNVKPVAYTKDLLKLSARPDANILTAERLGQKYTGEDARNNAAILIQSIYKMYKTRKLYWGVIPYIRAAKVFLKYRRMSYWKQSLRDATTAINKYHIQKAEELRKTYGKFWNTKSKKTIILVSTIVVDADVKRRTGETRYLQHRLFVRSILLTKTDLNIIFVSCREQEKDLETYRSLLMSMYEVNPVKLIPSDLHPEIQRFDERFKVIYPENANFFKSNSGLTQMLLCSPNTLQELRALIADKEAYIYPGCLSVYDMHLSSILDAPLFSPPIDVYDNLTKMSYARQLFQSLQISTPLAVDNIQDKNEFYQQLATLIFHYPNVTRWLIMIEHGASIHQGIAYLDMGTHDFSHFKDVKTLMDFLMQETPALVVLAQPEVYVSWERFFAKFIRSRGSIMAAYYDSNADTATTNMDYNSMVHVRISCNGTVEYRGSTDLLTGKPHVPMLELIPQRRFQHQEIWAYTLEISKSIYSMGAYGYFSIEFTHSTGKDGTPKGKALGLRIYPYYSPQAGNCDLFLILTDSNFDTASGNAYHDSNAALRRKIRYLQQIRFLDMNGVKTASDVEISSSFLEERHGIFCDTLYHSNFNFIEHSLFDSLIQTAGVEMDVKARTGTHLIRFDEPTPFKIALMCMQRQRRETVDLFLSILPIIRRYLSNKMLPGEDNLQMVLDRVVLATHESPPIPSNTANSQNIIGAGSQGSVAESPRIASENDGFDAEAPRDPDGNGFAARVRSHITTNFIRDKMDQQQLHADKMDQEEAGATIIMSTEQIDIEETERAGMEQEIPDRPERTFINPSAHLWQNPYEQEIQDPIERKRRLVASFIVDEWMTEFLANVDAKIEIIEEEQRAAQLMEEQRLEGERREEEEERHIQEQLKRQNESEALEAKRKLLLDNNTAIRTLRTVFQSSSAAAATDDDDDLGDEYESEHASESPTAD